MGIEEGLGGGDHTGLNLSVNFQMNGKLRLLNLKKLNLLRTQSLVSL